VRGWLVENFGNQLSDVGGPVPEPDRTGSWLLGDAKVHLHFVNTI